MNLDEGLPFYCLQGKGLDGSAPFNTVEEAAHCYLEVIREIQPHGPYYLGGYCFGGNVAFEMARMLKQLGEPVAPIVLIDSFNPAYSRSITKSDMLFRLLRFYIRRVAFHTRRIFSLSPTIWIQYTTGRIKAMYVHAQRYVKKAFKGGNEWPVDPTSAEVDAAINASLEQILKRMQKAGPNATRKFVPKPYSGDALVVRVSERNTDPYEDYFLGWRPVIKGALESIEIDSTHEDILREPAVRLMAAIIDARLRKYSSGIALPPAARIDPESPDAAAPMMEEEPVDYPLAH
jgi:thioesterase domain-containing protein